MRILFMGTPEFAVPSLLALHRAGHEICGVWTQPDKPQGRKMRLTPPPVKEAALELGVPVFQPETLKNQSQLTLLQQLQPELIVVVAYGKILPEYILRFPARGCINVHGSLLPKYRGAGPIQWAVIRGEKQTGVTTMYMAKELDAGDMLLKSTLDIGENETAGQVHDRLRELGAQLLLETLERLADGTLQPEPQVDEQATYAPMLNREMAQVDWNRPAREIHNQVRGMNPWPVAQTSWRGDPLKIYETELVGKNYSGQPGEILLASPKEGLRILCGDGQALSVLSLQMRGGKRMSAQDFLRGHAMPTGEMFG